MSVRKWASVFGVGFILGFSIGLVILYPSKPQNTFKKSPLEKAGQCSFSKLKSVPPYELWLHSKGLKRVPIDLDRRLYGHSSTPSILESEWLYQHVHVTCVVIINNIKNLKAIHETWLKRCNNYSLVHAKKSNDSRSKNFENNMNITTFKATSSWHFLCNVVRQLWRIRNKNLQWVIFVPDDIFVIPENLRYMVANLDWNKPFYLGHAVSLWKQSYNLASAGYVLSKESLRLLASNFTSDASCKKSGKYWKKEDFYLGKNLGALSISPSDTRDEKCRGRFHGYNLNNLLFESKLAAVASYWKSSLFPVSQGESCCSDSSVTFQGIEADKIHSYDYILNNLHVFTSGKHGNQPAPTPYPSEKVWQEFLRQRGVSYFANVSDQDYFKAWKTKIVEDLKNLSNSESHNFKIGYGEVFAVPLEMEKVANAGNP